MGSLRSYVCHTSAGPKLCWAQRLEMTESQFLSPWSSKILQSTGKCPCPLRTVSKYLPGSVSCYYTLQPPSISNWNLWNNHGHRTVFALKRVPSGNRDKMGHLHGGTELRKCEVQCQGGKLFTACDSRRGSARGRMSAPGSALLAGQISKMLAKRKQCHLEDEWTASLAAAEARLRCLAWHQTSVFLRQGEPHLTHPVWCHGCSYNTISFGQFPRGGRRMEISYRMP